MIYNIIIYLVQPLEWIRLLWRSRKSPSYRRRWSERYGFYRGKVHPGGILIHSVSVGETQAAIPLVRALRHRYPLLPITITTMTPSGSERVQSSFGVDVHHVYLPYDLPGAMSRFLARVNPKLVILMETELWPNLIKALHYRGIPLVVANARLSARSAAGYKRFSGFVADIMRRITLIAAQNEADGTRFLGLGLKENQLVVTGSLKFDISISPADDIGGLTLTSRRPVWIAASTHEGEEILLLQAHRHLLTYFPDLLMILVPRHPERFSVVREMAIKGGFNYIMRSSGKNPTEKTQVVVGDTMGELVFLYGNADLAFIGGSLVEHGGHNPLEAAVHAIPVLMGPHTLNFEDICRKLAESGGLISVTDVLSLINAVSILLKDEDYRQYCGYHAVTVLRQNQGALQRLMNLLAPYLTTHQG